MGSSGLPGRNGRHRAPAAVSILLGLWHRRWLVQRFLVRDLQLKYRGSALGFFWSLLGPLLLMIVYSVVFSLLVRISTPVPYPLFVLAGIPSIMKAMFESLQHRLSGGHPLLSKAVVAALPESYLAPGLGDIQAHFPEIEIGSYPFYRMGVFGVRLVLRGPQPEPLEAAAGEVRQLVRQLGADPKDKV